VDWHQHDGWHQEWHVCTVSDNVHSGCPVLHVLPGSHSETEALSMAILRHACIATLREAGPEPVTVEILSRPAEVLE
jgi:hypothetical protein